MMMKTKMTAGSSKKQRLKSKSMEKEGAKEITTDSEHVL